MSTSAELTLRNVGVYVVDLLDEELAERRGWLLKVCIIMHSLESYVEQLTAPRAMLTSRHQTKHQAPH